ncbi:amino acid transporter-like protein, putative [Bodo saltans]|uniref:Amino acid transporter-like protein, putative n=1 Tax=Bodo saltans TaxID=75058 RepID=A0A0S4JRJ5_BODSA|nr:amino acid transporter-like protein, putative [Bodo saltans]|eukprot:CUG93192.1 amino acid transporter-like protein, putative [Bodo saltans]
MSSANSQPPSIVPPISTAQPELPGGSTLTHRVAAGASHQTSVGGNDINSSQPQRQQAKFVRELITEQKTFPEDLQALTVDPSLVAYLSKLYQNSHLEHNNSFAGSVPPATPAVTSGINKNSSVVIKALTFVANLVGLSEPWALVRRLSPSPLADLSEAFRLYFGSNITIFPYLLSLGGTVGAVISAVPIAYLLDACVELQCEAKDVAVNVVLKKLVARDRSKFFGSEFGAAQTPSSCQNKTVEQQLKELEDFSARHVSVSSYFQLAEVLWTFPAKSSLTEVHQLDDAVASTTATTPTDNKELPRLQPSALSHEDVSSLAPSSSSHTTAPPQVEVRSIVPSIVRIVVGVAQFTSSCSFAILIATNIQALGLGLTLASVLTCIGLLVLLIVLTPNTLALFAMINNVCLLGGSVILIIATLTHQNGVVTDDNSAATTTTSDNDDVWLFFRSPTDAFMFFPTLFAYLTPALFAIDVETNIARRCIQRAVAKLTGGRERNIDTPAAVASPTTSKRNGEIDFHSTHGLSSPSPGAVVVVGSSLVPTSALLIRRFHYVTIIALMLALTVLLAFGEFIFMNFKSNTNAVIALSLRPGFLRTLLLWDLVIGISACAALNVAGLPNILDDMRLSERCSVAHKISQPVERIIIRVVIMAAVLVTLFVVPYFDLIASLAGSLGVNGFSFFLPVLFYLQGIRRTVEAEEESDHVIHLSPQESSSSVQGSPSALLGKRQQRHSTNDDDSNSSSRAGERRPLISYWAAFCRVPKLQMQITMVVMIVLGSIVLVTGVGSVASQLVSRLSAAE